MIKQLAIFAVAATAFTCASAHATTMTYQLTYDKCSGGCTAGTSLGTGVFATVSLTQDGSNVDVKETLANGEVFANTGAGRSLQFEITGAPSASIDATTLSSGFSVSTGRNIGSVGTFNFAVDCTSCGNGTSAPNYSGPLSFTVDNVSLSNFTALNGYYFASDIGTGTNFSKTGNVLGNTTPVTTASTPEPSSLALLGTGVFCAAGLVRRKFTN